MSSLQNQYWLNVDIYITQSAYAPLQSMHIKSTVNIQGTIHFLLK